MAAPAHEKSEMQHDVDHWLNRINHVTKDHSSISNPTGTAPWYSSFFACFNPIDTCLVTCCCPCITFGKTHHRLNKDGDLVGYKTVNASCLGWFAASCFAVHCIPSMLQRGELRERSQPNLQGNFVKDFLKSWCCSCCDLIQQEKEAQHLLSLEKKNVTMQQPGKPVGMAYGPQ